MIYFDNSATTQIDPRVLEAMLPYLQEEYGNPSAKYYTLATNANAAIENSRQQIASLLNCDSEEIIFTSGASESNNFIIKGIADFYGSKGKHIITSKIEHKSVLETCKYLETKGFKVTYLDVTPYGQVACEELSNAITEDTILVSLFWANNEIGTLNNIKELGTICHKENIFFHSDATQVIGKVNVNLNDLHVNFLSFSAHKMYGPKGIGGCFIRKDEIGLLPEITPLIHGGNQEKGYRSGTYSTHNIVGLGKAAEITKNEMEKYIPEIIAFELTLKEELCKQLPQVIFNGHPTEKIPGLLNITLPDVINEILIKKLHNDIALSTGSSCSFTKPSHVLQALNFTSKQIRNTIRLSIGKFNSNIDAQYIVELIKKASE